MFPHNNTCPAIEATCNNCHKFGHFARCCRSKEAKQGGRQSPLITLTVESSNSDSDSNENAIFSIMNDTSDSTVYKNMKAIVNDIPMSRSVVENNFTTVSEPESIANESPIVQVVNSLSKFKVELNVETSHPVQFLIDSGSALNILTFDTFNKINNTNGNLTLRKSATTVLTYGQDQPSLKILGVHVHDRK